MRKELIDSIQSISGLSLFLDHDLTKFSTLQLKSSGDLIICKTEQSVESLMRLFLDKKINYQIIGNGSNALLPEKLSTVVVKLEIESDMSIFNQVQDEYEVSASTPLNILTAKAIKHGFVGWNSFTGVPGTLGGAIFMNAGTSKGEIASIINEVKILRNTGHVEVQKVSMKDFSYRKNHFVNPGDIILSAKLRHLGVSQNVPSEIKSYLKHRSLTQPLWEKTCGCTFKNLQRKDETCAAGQVIDILGLKGFSHQGLKISPMHGNFIENTGGATKTGYLELINKINSKVEESNGYRFETEVISFY